MQDEKFENTKNSSNPKLLMDSGFLDSEMEIETVEIDSRNYKLTQDQNQAIIKKFQGC